MNKWKQRVGWGGLNSDLNIAIHKAITSSAVSKAVTLLVQVFALPLAVYAVGGERFGVYVMVTGFLSWLSLSSAGLFPSLTREVARHPDNLSHILQLFRHALTLVVALVAIMASAFLVILEIASIETLLGPHILQFSSEARLAAITALVCVILQVVGGAAEAVRTGLQQQHINNLWSIAGNVLSLPLFVLCIFWFPEIYFLVIATHGAPAFCKVLNLIQLRLWFRWKVMGTPGPFQTNLFRLLMGTGVVLFMGQVATLMSQQGSAYIVGYIIGPSSAADFSVMLRITIIAGGVVVMVSQPLGAAMTAALAKNDIGWINTTARNLGIFVMAYAIFAGLLIISGGPYIVSLWLGDQIKPQAELFWLTGFYFMTVVWSHLHYVALVALGETLFPTVVLLAEAVLMALLAVAATTMWGVTGGMLALLFANLLVSSTLNHLRLRRRLRNLAAA